MFSYIELAKERAEVMHKDHTYGDYSYMFHLEQVVSRVQLALDQDVCLGLYNDLILAAAWLHDTVEDCDLTIDQVKQWHGPQISTMVELVTDPNGKTRKERKRLLYERFNNTPSSVEKLGACIIKLADRYSNQFFSIVTNNRNKMNMYRIEDHDFVKTFAYENSKVHKGILDLIKDLKYQNEIITYLLDTK